MKIELPFGSVVIITILLYLTGCSTTTELNNSQAASKTVSTARTAADIGYREARDIEKVWLAPGFDFSGYNKLVIAPTRFAAVERPNEVELRTWAIRYLRTALVERLRNKKDFTVVTSKNISARPGNKVLKLENTIIEYEEGGRAARYFAGVFGAGHPIIRVKGIMTYNGRPMFRYEASRSGEAPAARMAGVFMSGQEIQSHDIDDLAIDLADFIHATATHTPQ